MATETGYKASELGMIPQDWDVVELGDVLKIRHGKNQKEVENPNGTYPILATGGQIGWATEYLYDKPSVLIGRKGTIDKPRYQDTPFWTVDTLFYSEIETSCSAKFIFYKFCLIDWIKNNEASGVPSQNAKTIEKIKISLPPLPEQTAIATALSDTDALISSLQTLVAKKKAIKLSAMQNLLSAKIRLPEFTQRPDGSPKNMYQTELGMLPEDWEVVELGEVLGYEQPGKYIIHNDDLKVGDIPVLTAGKTFILGYTREDFNCYENYPVIIFDDFTTDSKLVNFRFKVKSSAMKMLKPKKNDMPIELIFMLLQNINFIVGDHKRHWISEFQHLKIAIPKSPTEQTAIAQLLSDMDAEIEALECRLKKTQSLKQGMMQALLTGKIRLPLE